MTTSEPDQGTPGEPRCPTCQAIRHVGANFCSQCGTSFQPWGGSAPGVPPPSSLLDAPVRTVIRFGAALAIGFALVGAVVLSLLYVVSLILFVFVTS